MSIDCSALTECPICCNYFRIVSETHCCHSLYCKECLEEWSRSHNTCPSCRKALNINTCAGNIPIQRFVDAIPLECPFRLEGCNAKPPRSELERHKDLCEYRPDALVAQKAKRMRELNALKETLLKDSSRGSSSTAASLYDLAQKFLSAGAYRESVEVAERVLGVLGEEEKEGEEERPSPIKIDCLGLIGSVKKQEAQYSPAIETFEKAIRLARIVNDEGKIAEYQLLIGDILMKQAKFTDASTRYEEALILSKRALGETSAKTGEVLNSMGLLAKKCSEYDKAITSYTSAMHTIPSTHPSYPDIVNNLADVHRKKGNYKEARVLYESALKTMEFTHGQNHPHIADICNALGMLDKKEGRYAESMEYYKTAVRIGKHFFGDKHPNIGMYLTNIGDIYRKQGNYSMAENIYAQAITTLEAALGPNHVEVAEVLNSQGLVLKKRADYDGAEKLYKRSIDIVVKTFGMKHYKVGIYMNNLGDISRKRGRYIEALDTYNKALTAIEHTLGPLHSEAAEILHNIGLVKHQQSAYKEAVGLYEKALQIVKKEFGDKHYKVGMFLNSSGLAHAMLSNFDVAYEQLKQALQILIQCLGDQHIEVADCYTNLGEVCLKLLAEGRGRTKLAEAKKYYTEANNIVSLSLGPTHPKAQQFASLLFIVDNYDTLSQ